MLIVKSAKSAHSCNACRTHISISMERTVCFVRDKAKEIQVQYSPGLSFFDLWGLFHSIPCAQQSHCQDCFVVSRGYICSLEYITLTEGPGWLFRLSNALSPIMAFKYPQFEPYGNRLIRWMENTNEPGCPILRSTLTTWTLPQSILWHCEHEREWLSPAQVACIVGSGLPLGQLIPNDMYPTESPCLRQSIIKTRGGVTGLVGTIGPGLLFIYSIRRRSASNDPHVSELAKIAYETHFPLESVKHVIVNEVQENATEPFIEEHIYPSRERLTYPSAEPQTWDYATPEFRAIMGTPIGKVVGSFILGAFGQGVKRVSRIVTFQRGLELHKLDIRFDIEDVLTSALNLPF